MLDDYFLFLFLVCLSSISALVLNNTIRTPRLKYDDGLQVRHGIRLISVVSYLCFILATYVDKEVIHHECNFIHPEILRVLII